METVMKINFKKIHLKMEQKSDVKQLNSECIQWHADVIHTFGENAADSRWAAKGHRILFYSSDQKRRKHPSDTVASTNHRKLKWNQLHLDLNALRPHQWLPSSPIRQRTKTAVLAGRFCSFA